ncbi:50S ribosomal protein L24 [Candidatus Uhrbacteria bacterium RIFOXYB12_FULL_58_10]|uniref:Large ribosomal subunit protein uL24 n=1 Tax=Candidatus Uhrbacteria bacterium RIFOXYB2_FULL_57_15 TaxID=1802422 RepID=A0A1F7WAC0_9BACT|nr:MAG: 50S ribosomal protein L24 [Candidatus Uhrbacteria bacterium RIFOXYB12_FULL_58_10]OGL99024.1 MAG: 50S ribosomal protein L24 [Candidatus Uhrbacteria bacterium RIFOXYB2_FULL_57_15]OGM00244.1 MAG: 50S ribosomal protein L24 [Candidatus Uhrbacteria bacterium RIFOXYC12_FULL_57_11]
MKIKTGDNVRITAGKDKGKEGKVLQVFPKLERIVVENINLMTKHLKRRGTTQGQTIKFPSPLHVSNVRIVSEKSGKSGRIGFDIVAKDGGKDKVRVIRSKGASEQIE